MGVASAPLDRLRSWRAERELRPMIERARELSMLHDETLRDLEARVRWVLDEGLPGDLVECGVWPGGVVIVDDYYVSEGCAVAVHEFLGGRSLPHRIQTAADVAFFTKD